ncbi:MAG: hypothetical protein AAB572_00010 [Patescibacteria group bacterium]
MKNLLAFTAVIITLTVAFFIGKKIKNDLKFVVEKYDGEYLGV